MSDWDKNKARPRVIGLSGGIGSGKSTIAGLLAAHGAVVIDADAIAREVVEPGTPALAEIAAEWPGTITGQGTLDRPALGAIVFSDPKALERLNQITHPRIAARSAELIERAGADALIVYDVPLLVENNLQAGYDLVVIVDAGEQTRLDRLRDRGLSPEDASARIAAQATREARLGAADVVIDNDGSLEETRKQVDSLWARLAAD